MTSDLHYVILIENGHIYFDLGYNQGVREGMHFQIYRMDDNGQPVKLARMGVTETFDQVSKGVLVDEDVGVEVKAGDRIEIRPRLKREGIAEARYIRAMSHEPPRAKMQTTARRWSWATLAGGVVTGGLAVNFRNSMNDAFDRYKDAVDPSELEDFRSDTKSNLWRYRIFASISIGLLGYSGYKLFWNGRSADTGKIPLTNLGVSPIFSHNHLGATFRYNF